MPGLTSIIILQSNLPSVPGPLKCSMFYSSLECTLSYTIILYYLYCYLHLRGAF